MLIGRRVDRVRDEPRLLCSRCPGLDLVPVVARGGLAGRVAVELEETFVVDRQDRRHGEAEVLQQQ